MKKLAVIATLVAALVLPLSASAKTLNNKFGIGGEVGTVSGLSLKYWLGHFGFQVVLGFDTFSPEGTGTTSTSHFDLAIRVQGNIARARDTNLFAGAGAAFTLVDNPRSTDIEVFLGVEHWFGEHFSIHGKVNLIFDLNGLQAPGGPAAAGTYINFGRNAGGGGAGVLPMAGFTFYF